MLFRHRFRSCRKQSCTLDGKPWPCWEIFRSADCADPDRFKAPATCEVGRQPPRSITAALLARCTINGQSLKRAACPAGAMHWRGPSEIGRTTSGRPRRNAPRRRRFGLWQGQFHAARSDFRTRGRHIPSSGHETGRRALCGSPWIRALRPHGKTGNHNIGVIANSAGDEANPRAGRYRGTTRIASPRRTGPGSQ